METKDFLFEIGCEELPASCLTKIAFALKEEVAKNLTQARLTFAEIALYFTPRRIALIVKSLSVQQPSKTFLRQGPSAKEAFGQDGLPTIACLGFIKACGVTLDELRTEDTDRGRYVFCEITQNGAATATLLPELIAQAISKLPIPKPMRWADHDFAFVRPVHWIVMLLGTQILEATILGKKASNETYGHRFLHPAAIALHDADDYVKKLASLGKVIPCVEDRKTLILQQADQLPLQHAHPLIDDQLLNEVAILVEWPVVLLGHFKTSFLKVPAEVLVTSMQGHQRCFPVFNDRGELSASFIITSNIASKDPQAVIRGNERVINARLSDAEFFYTEDLKTPLIERAEALKSLVFQEQLGSIADKCTRMEKLANLLAKNMQVDLQQTELAVQLSKCDLVTDMVYEFPELQGVMGYYYALHNRHHEDVAIALKEQYLPRFSGDQLPKTNLGCILALVDRVDTLIGIFAINKKPSGDKDPFGLRRAALGIIHILMDKTIPIRLIDLLEASYKLYKNLPNKKAVSEALQFILERMKIWYQENKVSNEVFNAVAANEIDTLADFNQRVQAVIHFLQLPEAESLAQANKRVSNILKKQDLSTTKVEAKLLMLTQEKALHKLITEKTKIIKQLCQQKNYAQALTDLATLKQPIDDFFDNIKIMDDNQTIKNNRLALLASLKKLLSEVADISLLVIN